MTNLNQKLVEAIDALIPEAGLQTGWAWDAQGEMLMYHKDGWKNVRGRKSKAVRVDYREPELRHVLWALDVSTAIASFEDGTFTDYGNVISADKEMQGYDVYASCDYDLTKPLFNQTEETKQFLLNLLKQ